MRFYKTSEYAIRALVFLANNDDRLYSVRELHKTLNIPYKYLSRLMYKLNHSGLVTVKQGKFGGYRLGKDKASITLADIIEAVEGLENYERCILGFEQCSDDNPCALHYFWLKHRETIKNELLSLTLADLSKDPDIRM
ncbi:MAG: Rrf2 family transcriptional regulator [Caldithrix sp.]|nr:Rrf2 family transcriptional regulator [Caldithrix sp.]